MKSHHRHYSFFNNLAEKDSLLWRFKDIEYFNGEAVLLIRNPFEAIRSSWNHIYGGGLDLSIYSTKFKQFACEESDMWLQIIIDWMLIGNNVIVVFYEDLVKDWEKELRTLLSQFLDMKPNEQRFECTKNMNLMSSKRKKMPLEDNPFDKRIADKINRNINEAREILMKFNYKMPSYTNIFDI